MIAYLAHPATAATPEGVRANLARARRWLAWLVLHSDLAIECSWIAYIESLGEDGGLLRARGLRDNCRLIERVDMIILCGGSVTAGMALERATAHRTGKGVVSLIDLGLEPPPFEIEAARVLLRARVRLAAGS